MCCGRRSAHHIPRQHLAGAQVSICLMLGPRAPILGKCPCTCVLKAVCCRPRGCHILPEVSQGSWMDSKLAPLAAHVLTAHHLQDKLARLSKRQMRPPGLHLPSDSLPPAKPFEALTPPPYCTTGNVRAYPSNTAHLAGAELDVSKRQIDVSGAAAVQSLRCSVLAGCAGVQIPSR